MSANNYLLISQKGKKYIILNKDVDCGRGFMVGEADTFKEANKLAHKYAQEEIVEYGVRISDKILSKIKD